MLKDLRGGGLLRFSERESEVKIKIYIYRTNLIMSAIKNIAFHNMIREKFLYSHNLCEVK